MNYRILTFTLAAGFLAFQATTNASPLTSLEELGKKLFFDTSLSNPPGQSCASCHLADTGGTGADSAINLQGVVVPGVIHTRTGNRKPPTVAYAGYTPVLHKCNCSAGNCTCGGGVGGGGMGGGGMGGGGMTTNTFAGGMFWDGRATGWSLGDPLRPWVRF